MKLCLTSPLSNLHYRLHVASRLSDLVTAEQSSFSNGKSLIKLAKAARSHQESLPEVPNIFALDLNVTSESVEDLDLKTDWALEKVMLKTEKKIIRFKLYSLPCA